MLKFIDIVSNVAEDNYGDTLNLCEATMLVAEIKHDCLLEAATEKKKGFFKRMIDAILRFFKGLFAKFKKADKQKESDEKKLIEEAKKAAEDSINSIQYTVEVNDYVKAIHEGRVADFTNRAIALLELETVEDAMSNALNLEDFNIVLLEWIGDSAKLVKEVKDMESSKSTMMLSFQERADLLQKVNNSELYQYFINNFVKKNDDILHRMEKFIEAFEGDPSWEDEYDECFTIMSKMNDQLFSLNFKLNSLGLASTVKIIE